MTEFNQFRAGYVALVGRPNVGKSTLFNRLTSSRDAIVADFAGLTRDRHYGNGRMGASEYIVIDTGGFEPDASEGIYREMAKQTRQAVAESDVVIFVVDARAGISAQDHEIAQYLRRLGKPTVLVANKAEGMTQGLQLVEFFELGLGEVMPVSGAHGQGIRSMLDKALESIPGFSLEGEDEEPVDPTVIRLAVAGRPNVGKSTLINAWLGEERLVAFDMPGIDTAVFAARAGCSKPSKSSPLSKRSRRSKTPTWFCCCWMPRRV